MAHTWNELLNYIDMYLKGIDNNFTKNLIERDIDVTSLPDEFKEIANIGNSAFSGCTNLALTSLPSGIISIKRLSFFSCSNLALTSLPDGVTNIEHDAFYNCINLALTSLPESITNIGTHAFTGCTNLSSITFKGTPDSIGESVFEYCTNLTTINVPWAEGAVAGAPWGATNATINYNYVIS